MPEKKTDELNANAAEMARIQTILDRSAFLPILPLVVLAAAFFWQVQQLTEALRWVDHTDRAIAEAHQIEGSLMLQQSALRGYVLTREHDFLAAFRNEADGFDAAARELGEMVSDNPAQARRLDAIREAVRAWQRDHAETMLATMERGEAVAPSQIVASRLDAVRAEIATFTEEETRLREERTEQSRDVSTRALFFGFSAITGIALFLVWLVRRQLGTVSSAYRAVLASARERAEEIRARERELSEAMSTYGGFIERLAAGHLGAEVVSVGNEDLRELGDNLAELGSSLGSTVFRIREAVAGLSTATAEILSTTQQQSASASESAVAAAQTAATVDEVSQSAQQTAERARAVATASQRSVDVSNAGRAAIERTVGTITALRAQVDSIAERILALSEQAQLVGQIITTVNELAEQSNMLALNASIEAARAGEQGRSFAVVAQEVRALAEQSKAATAQVRSILGDIQKSTTAAVLVTEQGSKAAAAAVDAVREVGTRIEQLSRTIEEAAEAANVIVGAAQQQVTGVSQISQAMQSINLATSQAVEGTRQTERAARDLNDLTGRLRETASQFRS